MHFYKTETIARFRPVPLCSARLMIAPGSCSDPQWLKRVQLLSVTTTGVPSDLQWERCVYIAGGDEEKAPGSQNEVPAVCVLLAVPAGSVCCR